MTEELKTHILLSNLVESPMITHHILVSETQKYDDKERLIKKAIDRKIFSDCLYHRDVQLLDHIIDHLLSNNNDNESIVTENNRLIGTNDENDINENDILDLIVSWKQ